MKLSVNAGMRKNKIRMENDEGEKRITETIINKKESRYFTKQSLINFH